MASIRQIMSAIEASVSAVTTGLVFNGAPVAVMSGVGWPSIKVLQNVAKGGPCIIGVYDRKVGKDSTRWNPYPYDQVNIPATLTTSVSLGMMPPLGSSIITLGAAPSPGDAVSAVFTNYALSPREMAASVAIAGVSDTSATMATALAALINGDPVISTWAQAVATGDQIAITSLSLDGMVLASYVGNGGTQVTELGRRERQIQIVCWTMTEELRALVSDPIDTMIAVAEADFGLTLSDGNYARLMSESDFYLEDETLSDVYRRDFLIRVDYPVTTIDKLYAIVAPIQNYAAP